LSPSRLATAKKRLGALLQPSLVAEFARYFGAGLLALAVDFALYLLLTELAGWHYLVSGTVAFCAGLVTIYFFSISWIFRDRRTERKLSEFGIFAVIGVAGLALTTFILYALTEGLGLDYRASKLVSAGLVFVFNFGCRKFFLFRTPANRGNPHRSDTL
jgi:putative flippase GtrA